MRIEKEFRAPIPVDEASMALMVNPYYVHGLVEYHRKRVGRYNQSASNTYRFAIQLVQKNTGWLRNQPRLIEKLPKRDIDFLVSAFKLQGETPEELWEALCDLCLNHLRIYWKRVKKEIAKQPSPAQERLRPILMLPEPDDVLVEMHAKAEKYIASLREGDTQRHTFADLLSSRLLMDTGLRGGHFHRMQLGVHLERSLDNIFKLRIPVADFKNWNSRAFKSHGEEDPRMKSQVFDLDDPELQRELLVYVDVIRPQLLGGMEHDYLFPVYTTGEEPRGHSFASRIVEFSSKMLKMSDLDPAIKDVRYLSPHSYRYILGTAVAKRFGLEAASVFLLDTLEVTNDTYARWVPSELHEDVARRVRSSRTRRSV